MFFGFHPNSKRLTYLDTLEPVKGEARAQFVEIDLSNGKSVRTSSMIGLWGSQGTISANGHMIGIGGAQTRLAEVWKVASWEKSISLKVPAHFQANGTPLAFSADGKYVFGTARQNLLKPPRYLVWDMANGDFRLLGKEQPVPDKTKWGKHPPQTDIGEINLQPIVIMFSRPNGPCDLLFYEERPDVHHKYAPVLVDVRTGEALPIVKNFTLIPNALKPYNPVNTQWGIGSRKGVWALQGEMIGPNVAPRYAFCRFRVAPNGWIVAVPRYDLPPISIVRYMEQTWKGKAVNFGTIGLVVTPAGLDFSKYPNPYQPGIELCQLSDFDGARDWEWSCQLSPDGKKLAGVWRSNAPRPEGWKSKIIGSPSQLVVWDLTPLYPKAEKLRAAAAAKKLPDSWWEQLSEPPAYLPKAHGMLALLAARPKEAVELLKKKLGSPPNIKEVPQLLVDLDSANPTVRELATMKLKQFGPAIQSTVQVELAKPNSPEKHLRLQAIMKEIDTKTATNELRLLYVVDLLEHLATPSARELLEVIATGSYGSVAAEAAQASRKMLVNK
jgi:hypothetical protein